MARIRSIKPEYWSSEQVMECSPIARLLFIGLWNFCDDAGNHVASERTIKAEIFPGDDISSTDVRRLLDELSSNKLIAFYTNDSKDYLHVTGWRKHQKIDRPTYKHPAYSESDRRALDESSPPEGKGVEGSGEEGKEQSSLRSDSSPQLTLTGTAPQAADPKAKRADRIRQIAEEAQGAFNATLGKPHGLLAKCTVLNKPRLRAVENALPTVRQLCQQLFGSERVTPQFWQLYFETAADDDFYAGRVRGGQGHENYVPDFELLLREKTIAKLADKALSEVVQ